MLWRLVLATVLATLALLAAAALLASSPVWASQADEPIWEVRGCVTNEQAPTCKGEADGKALGVSAASEASPKDTAIEVIEIIFAPEYHAVATCIAGAETGGRYLNGLVGAAGEVSVWQIHPIHFGRFDSQLLQRDTYYATWAAYQLSDGGADWRAWSTQYLCEGY